MQMESLIKCIQDVQPISRLPAFPYRRLGTNEIRLLVLQPGKGGSAVEVEIRHTSLDQNPSYEALSYCWGEPNNTRLISLKAQNEQSLGPNRTHSKLKNTASLSAPERWIFPYTLQTRSLNTQRYQFQATSNLESALRHLRHESETRTLWIDAICIDQQDDVEKGCQVGQMDQIYKKCSRVCIWLGGAADNSDAAIDMLNMMLYGSQMTKCEDGRRPFEALAVLFMNDDRWILQFRALLKVYCRPWFFRLWGKLF
jgi:hypothetical protein